MEPVARARVFSVGGRLLEEVNENPLLFRHSNVDRLDIATSGVIFLFNSNDGPSEISRRLHNGFQ